MLSTFSSLLRISQVGAFERRAAFRIVNLTEIASEVAELFEPAAEERACFIVLVSGGPAYTIGDRDLLFDAFSNLIDNAIKHGGPAREVTIEVSGSNGCATVAVADQGPGIPIEERQNVFKRFYRLERSRNTPGNGLGLSLVAAVAHLHSARIELADNAPGLKVQLCFPPAQP